LVAHGQLRVGLRILEALRPRSLRLRHATPHTETQRSLVPRRHPGERRVTGPALEMFDLSGHVAIVTGGNGGIGLAMAKGLAMAGANVALWGRNAEKNAAAVDALCGLGCDAAAFACDVASEEEIVATMARTLERFGRVDSCFANAGIGLAKPFLEMSVDDWDAVMQVNLVGAFLTFREALKHIVERGGGG